ncbi:hypothetical protein ACFQZT_28510 [Paenibacillus sp. GCM10027628]|uniref:hypothetical protein n=1 Tax=Paenibacillus sp. GCM10027628 TaxID=3273413 RepID=UPI003639359A
MAITGRGRELNDNFTGVHFPGIGSLDVLWSSLEIIDEEYLLEIEERRKQSKKNIKVREILLNILVQEVDLRV